MKCFLKLKNGDFPCLVPNCFFVYKRLVFIRCLLFYYYANEGDCCYSLEETTFVRENLGKRVKKIEEFFAEKYPFFSLYSFSCVPAVFYMSQYYEGVFLLKFFPYLDAIYFRFEELFKNTLGFTIFDSFSQAEKFITLLEKRYNKKSRFLSICLSNIGYLSLSAFFNDIKIVKGYSACASCGKLFQLNTSKDSLCASCSFKQNNEMGYCVICGKSFKYRKGKKTCSDKCRMKLSRKGGDYNEKK